MRTRLIMLLVGLCLSQLSRAAVTVSERQVSEIEGRTLITVRNEYFSLELTPLGGQIVGFTTRYSPRPWLQPGANGINDGEHLCMDNFLGQQSPLGELCFLPRDYEITQHGPERCEIVFQAVTKARMRLTKTFTIEQNSPAITVKLTLANESKDFQGSYGLWPSSILRVAGQKEKINFFRPYRHGVLVTGWDPAQKRNVGEDFLNTPADGWTAAIQQEAREGLVWLLDYNWLRTLYNCHSYNTVEWFYDVAPLPAGKAWETTYAVVLVKDFDGIAHASPQVIAGVTMAAKQQFDLVNPGAENSPRTVQLTHTLSRSRHGELRDVTVSGSIREVDGDARYPLPDHAIKRLTWEPQSFTDTVKAPTDIRLLYQVTLTAVGPDGKPVREQYEYYWPGSGGEKFNLVAGRNQATYVRPLPRKVRHYSRPEKLSYHPHLPPRVLEFRGPGAIKLKVTEAAAKAGFGDLRVSFFSTDWSGGKCSLVPAGYEEVFAHDLFVLNGASAQALSDFFLQALRDYVDAGGSVLVIGGLYAFGPGGYAGTSLEDLLPVTLAGQAFDLERLPAPAGVAVAREARCLRGLAWAGPSYGYWRHRVTPKAGSWTELTLGGAPLLVCGVYGKGRVAALASGPLGDPKPGETPFWEHPRWPEALARVIRWLAFNTVEER
ncbi:MAG: glutamine amidotransferase [Armatimonadota bacterium]